MSDKKLIFAFLAVSSFTACNQYSSIQQEPTCTPECMDPSVAIICNEDGQETSINCLYGCTDFACNPAPGSTTICIPNCSNSTATICQNDGTPSQITCKNGCDDVSCAKSPPQNNDDQCTPGCEGNNAVICQPDGSKKISECKFGCQKGSCNPDPSSPNQCKPSCTNNVSIICDADGKPHTFTCPYGCDVTSCASNQPPTSGPCNGITCKNNGSCDRGICVSQDMAKVKEGDRCDKWFQGYCNGNTKVTCVNNEITYSDCSDVNGCAMSKLKIYGDTYLIPTCRKDGASCESGKTGYCVTENNAGVTETHAYPLACYDNTDDTMSGEKSDYLICANGCNPQKTSCWNQCNGDTLNMYNETTLNCLNNNQICVTEDQNGFCADSCWQDGEIKNECYYDNERRRECHADDKGKLYYTDSYFMCDHGCDESTGKCKKLVHDEYSACDWNTFEQRCENDIRVSCFEGIVRAEKCSNENDVCSVIQNAALCIHECTQSVTKYCDGDNLVTQTCEINEAGKLVVVSIKSEHCPYSCDQNTLQCSCNRSGYWCENNELTHCDTTTNTVVHTPCDSKFCGEVGSGADCFDKKYSSKSDCYKDDTTCLNNIFYSNKDCFSGNDGFGYGRFKQEYCAQGCSIHDGCCNLGEKLDSSSQKCICDIVSGYVEGRQPHSCICPDGHCNNLQPGNIITFGNNHGQDDPLEWMVLDVDKSKRRILIIEYDSHSRSHSFCDDDSSPTWENSDLRNFLNTEYMNDNFDTVDQSRIILVTNKTPNNSEYGTYGGNDTNDKIFILSIEEFNKYNLMNHYQVGWLRTPGHENGYFYWHYFDVMKELYCTSHSLYRAVMWISY